MIEMKTRTLLMTLMLAIGMLAVAPTASAVGYCSDTANNRNCIEVLSDDCTAGCTAILPDGADPNKVHCTKGTTEDEWKCAGIVP